MASRKKSPTTLIWARLAPEREAQPALSRGQIVSAAMRLADAEGLGSITMRRVAAELGAGAMSLYRHVAGKNDVLDLLLDEAFREITLPAGPSDDWQAGLRQMARETRRTLKRHPWLAVLLSSRPPLGPHYLRYFDSLLGTVAGLGLDIQTMVRVVGTVHVYVLGYVSYELGEEENTRQTGLSEADKHRIAAPYVQAIIDSGRYPNFARFFASGSATPTDEDFAFGLDALLAGLAAHLPGSPAAG
jgi:AcrR family transcriptional regulator